jgi:hypothetical protein
MDDAITVNEWWLWCLWCRWRREGYHAGRRYSRAIQVKDVAQKLKAARLGTDLFSLSFGSAVSPGSRPDVAVLEATQFYIQPLHILPSPCRKTKTSVAFFPLDGQYNMYVGWKYILPLVLRHRTCACMYITHRECNWKLRINFGHEFHIPQQLKMSENNLWILAERLHL